MKKPTAEVRLIFSEATARLVLKVGGETEEQDIFVGKASKRLILELTQCLYDDAYDLVNYTLNGFSQQQRR